MTVELRPLGIACNLQCQYCYQNPQRDSGQSTHPYGIEKMKAAVEREGPDMFSLFGGEALLVPEEDLETLWAWGFEKFKRNGIQTNGILINDNHVRMFKQYNVHVGLSLDGPGELNDVRWAGTLERTRQATAKTHAAIERLSREGISFSLIVTLHRGNATADKLPVMHEWLRALERVGVRSARLHILETETQVIHDKYALSPDENVAAMLSFNALEKELTQLKFDLFKDMRTMMSGQEDHTTCLWNACDPYTTRSCHGIEGNGQSSNCGRTNKDGIDFSKADVEGFERYLALYQTPQEYGGCKGCRFFLVCKGHCPSTAIDNDWRNRTVHCEVWKRLYETIEQDILAEGKTPVSLHEKLGQIEQVFLTGWSAGRNTNSIAYAMKQVCTPEGSSRASQDRRGREQSRQTHRGTQHGDSPHGDHTDQTSIKQAEPSQGEG